MNYHTMALLWDVEPQCGVIVETTYVLAKVPGTCQALKMETSRQKISKHSCCHRRDQQQLQGNEAEIICFIVIGSFPTKGAFPKQLLLENIPDFVTTSWYHNKN